MRNQIAKIEVFLVRYPVKSGLADATRKVENIGYTIVQITTNQGHQGIGITYNEVGGEATKVLIEESIAPRLIGRNPFETEVLYHDLVQYLRGVGRKGLSFCAISAVDIALWDLKGKMLDMPLYRLLGGNRKSVPVYASGGWTSYDENQLVEEMKSFVASGYAIIKFKVGVEGGQNIARDVRRVKLVREAVGADIGLLLDANNCWDGATGARFANLVKEYDIMFLEEPTFADDIPGLKRFKQATDMPLATGEHEYTRYGCRDLILSEAADVIQMDFTRAGGYTEALKVAALTQAWNLKFAPHAMELIHLPLAGAMQNIPFLERLILFEQLTDVTFKDCPKPQNGYLEMPELPGLGLEINWDFVLENR
ncbi:MAG: mandelate racemase/muconate lactonizing enzyme family protein [Lachnospiraceae bacterium]|nr:mandelate racemase/muconate lactonizing enzyme family protein [Lachnospiraceae bacterium]